MQKICLFYRQILGINNIFISSLAMMISLVIMFYVLFFSRIKHIEEMLYPITSIPLTIYTILTKTEPSVLIIIIAVLMWIIVLLSSLWIDNRIICRVQLSYALISVLLGAIVIVGKTF